MAETRIYVVTDKAVLDRAQEDEKTLPTPPTPPTPYHLVDAGNPAQAVRAVTKDRFDVKVATQYDLVKLMAAGVRVVEAKSDVES